MSSLFRFALVGCLAITSLSVHASCARSVSSDVESGGLFLEPDGSAGPSRANLCVETTCPAPYATCPGELGLCKTDLTSDVSHCGSCDTPCPVYPPNASSLCSAGACRIACDELFADCNGLAKDGCETSLVDDPAHCGGCNTVCAAGEICWRGACGCPSGFSVCGKECKALDSDNANCGACLHKCGPPESLTDPAWICGPGIGPPNTAWSCGSSTCQLSCKDGFGDCNKQLCDDGCEIDLSRDPANCGACGNRCDPGQMCSRGACLCPPGMTRCGTQCVDLETDPTSCGTCFEACEGPSSDSPKFPGGGSPVCVGGHCSYVCFAGFANCNGRIDDGCEVELRNDPNHCGSCGTKCNVAAGQPCVEGKCLTRECDAGVIR